jgi:hypothetical protein
MSRETVSAGCHQSNEDMQPDAKHNGASSW